MGTFEVRVREITQLDHHPNADRLELVVIGGYKAVVKKDVHKVGDLILYVPEDTVFKNLEIAEKLGVASYLTGKQKNRVKAVKLRGVLSQGIVIPMSAFDGVIRNDPFPDPEYPDKEEWWHPAQLIYPDYPEEGYGVSCSEDIIELLQLEKYEEPIPIEMAGKIRRWPSFLPKYDVENIKRPESMAAIQVGEEVVVTEKLHGTNFTVAIGPGLEEGEEAFVCSRNNALQESDTNVYWRAARKFDLVNCVQAMVTKTMQAYNKIVHGDDRPILSASIHGEVVGVQDLKYGFVNGDIGFYAFDIMINGEFVDYDRFRNICDTLKIPMVPVLYRGPYDYDTISKLATGQTTFDTGEVLEGVVVKPVKERTDLYAGRVQFKFINEDYLLRKGGSELH